MDEWLAGTDVDPQARPRPPDVPEPPSRRFAIIAAVAGAVFVLALGGVAIAVFRASWGSTTDERPDVAAPEPTRDRPTGALDWIAVESPLGWLEDSLWAEDGAFYALSTAPGERWAGPRPTQAIYRSDDAEAWTVELLTSDLWVGDLAFREDTLYALGTAPGEANLGPFGDGVGPASARVGASTDYGRTWEYVDLPVVATPPPDLNVSYGFSKTKIAAGDAGIVAIVKTTYEVDLSSLVPPEFMRAETWVEQTEDGIRVIDHQVFALAEEECMRAMEEGGFTGAEPAEELPEPCQLLSDSRVRPEGAVTFSATWAELGMEDPAPSAFSELFVSADGKTYETVDSPLAPRGSLLDLFAVDDGFVALEWPDPNAGSGLQAWHSATGHSWELLADLPRLDFVAAAGVVGDRLALAGSVGSRPMVVTWDGTRWTEEADPMAALPEHADGEGGGWVSSASVGPLGVAMAVNGWIEGGRFEEPERYYSYVLHSTDLTSWDVISVEDVAGSPFEGDIQNVMVGGDQIIARMFSWNERGPLTLDMIGTHEL